MKGIFALVITAGGLAAMSGLAGGRLVETPAHTGMEGLSARPPAMESRLGPRASVLTEGEARTRVQAYADNFMPGFKVTEILPFSGIRHIVYEVKLSDAGGQVRSVYINVWGDVARFIIPVVRSPESVASIESEAASGTVGAALPTETGKPVPMALPSGFDEPLPWILSLSVLAAPALAFLLLLLLFRARDVALRKSIFCPEQKRRAEVELIAREGELGSYRDIRQCSLQPGINGLPCRKACLPLSKVRAAPCIAAHVC